MRFLSLVLSVVAVSSSHVSALGPSTFNNAGGYGAGSISLEAGRYEPHEHAHSFNTLAEAVHFTYDPYDEEAGPAKWANIPDTKCGGTSQSPIVLPKYEAAKFDATLKQLAPTYNKDYTANTLAFRNTGHALQVNIPDGLSLSGGALGANPYKVLQFHMHGRSEHTIQGGASYPLEIHIVHTDPTRNQTTDPRALAVLGIMVTEGPENDKLLPLTNLIPGFTNSTLIFKDGTVNLTSTFNLNSILPTNLDYYHYNGSLTTPPCSEQVVWHVLTTPITASREQILKLTFPFGNVGNARPTQNLNGRSVAVTSFQTTTAAPPTCAPGATLPPGATTAPPTATLPPATCNCNGTKNNDAMTLTGMTWAAVMTMVGMMMKNMQ